MTDMILAPALLPELLRTYRADVPLRLWDHGKWSDVEKFLTLIGGGAVLNLCGLAFIANYLLKEKKLCKTIIFASYTAGCC